MTHNIGRLTALILILLATISTLHAKRLLLPPPDGYKGVEINGVKYIVGQVYVPQFADTNDLKQYGFRAFDAVGSTVNYKKVKAIWPLDTDLKALPDYIVGLTYEKARSIEEMERAYKDSDVVPIGSSNFTNYGTYFYNTGYYSNTTNQYYGGSGYCGDGRPGSWAPYRAWPHDYNPEAYRYRTTSRTNLKPTVIGSYPENRFLKRKYWGGGPVR